MDVACLGSAAEQGDARRVDLLLSRGAKADIRNEEGYTPLMVAAEQGNLSKTF